MARHDKAVLRAAVRRAAGSAAELAEESRRICCHVLNWDGYLRAETVGAYMPMAHEADILPVLEDALRRGKRLALPLCGRPPEMSFRLVRDLAQLRTGRYGIPEPDAAAPAVPPEEINMLLTPLEGIDAAGMRLGKGGGYYDCLLARHRLPCLGVALSWQWVDSLPHDEWDQPLTAVVDARGIHMF